MKRNFVNYFLDLLLLEVRKLSKIEKIQGANFRYLKFISINRRPLQVCFKFVKLWYVKVILDLKIFLERRPEKDILL